MFVLYQQELGCLRCFMPSAEETAEGAAMLSPQRREFDTQHIETERK
jgi:hypothetical protein